MKILKTRKKENLYALLFSEKRRRLGKDHEKTADHEVAN